MAAAAVHQQQQQSEEEAGLGRRLLIRVPSLVQLPAGHGSTPLLPTTSASTASDATAGRRRHRRGPALLVGLAVCLVLAAAAATALVQLVRRGAGAGPSGSRPANLEAAASWSSALFDDADRGYPSTFSSPDNHYRTAFHFQPDKNWMNGRFCTALHCITLEAEKSVTPV